MKLLLTSTGFANQKIGELFVSEIGNPIEQKNILIVVYAQNDREQFYVDESVKEIKALGFIKIIIFNLHTPINIEKIPRIDAVYVCGGNTYSILKKMRETGIANFIISQVKKGAMYVGVSAGSIIAGPEIKIAGYGSEGDSNDVGLVDLKGLKLTDVIIFPHFKESLRSEVDSFQKIVGWPVVALTDSQVLFIADGKSSLIE
jgi:dipeptidase E